MTYQTSTHNGAAVKASCKAFSAVELSGAL